MILTDSSVTIGVTGLVDAVRFIDIALAILALISMIPFSGLKRLHPLIYPAMMLLVIYTCVNLFTEIGRWNTVLTWRLPLNLVAAGGCLWFGVVCNRIANGKKTKIPFLNRWVVPYTGQSVVTNEDDQVIYTPSQSQD